MGMNINDISGGMNDMMKFMIGYKKGQEIRRQREEEEKRKALLQQAIQSGQLVPSGYEAGGMTWGKPKVEKPAYSPEEIVRGWQTGAIPITQSEAEKTAPPLYGRASGGFVGAGGAAEGEPSPELAVPFMEEQVFAPRRAALAERGIETTPPKGFKRVKEKEKKINYSAADRKHALEIMGRTPREWRERGLATRKGELAPAATQAIKWAKEVLGMEEISGTSGKLGRKQGQNTSELRMQATKELQAAGAPITEANIQEAIRQLER